MQKIEIIGLTIPDLERLLDESVERVIAKHAQQQQIPSEYEELTLEQAAAELHCHKSTLRRKMLEAGIKGSKLGKEITLQRKDLKRLKRQAH
ncbi:MerR family transcriptional regulator [Chitinophaga pinensis]|uniref:Uncharacterized protein n=1 Tax=Chitinophaga pinensis (strain ATCC 43595 / DSM 2588 / LMG 13176 / NBRC 15968 / NCIMB 11800 / UQM 2034) TaxID=485918 RepID=A0A979G5L1_CHIPD|nr:helix-turn-helix domain-containing protein [Chitinophaga pinensis]ACU61290.1 hypothetical protein Cpin_3828 [Chitinophaga pinensis DSM 2588]